MKKKVKYLLIALLCSSTGFAQYTLKTSDGKTVQLYPNGTWEFVSNDKPVKQEKSTAWKRTYTSKSGKFHVDYDPTLWVCDTLKKAEAYPWDASFRSISQELTAFCFDTRLMLPMQDIEPYMREQYETIGKITSLTSQKDTINGIAMTRVDIELDVTGIPYLYRGYIHSDYLGSFQFWVTTQKNIFKEDEKAIVRLIEGIRKSSLTSR